MAKKYNESETRTISRKSIKFAPYNPRKQDPKVVEKLKKNFSKVGFLGGIVWNETTGCLVSGHKRIEAMDILNNYDGNNDYSVKVEVVHLDLKTEKEQNVFMNSPSAMGEFDFGKMRDLIPDIDYKDAGLTEADLNIWGIDLPNQNIVEDTPIEMLGFTTISEERKQEAQQEAQQQGTQYEPPKMSVEERIEAVNQLKQEHYENSSQKAEEVLSYFMLNFKNLDEREDFLQMFDIDLSTDYIDGTTFLEKVNDYIEMQISQQS